MQAHRKQFPAIKLAMNIAGHGATGLRAYPNNRVVMRPSEKFEAKAAGQKCSEAEKSKNVAG